jgi:copper homeostasis protein
MPCPSLKSPIMIKPQIEVCCGSIADVHVAHRLGADRIELNLALELGGLTPSVGLLQAAKRTTTIPIMVMIRPHNGPYDYSEDDFELMKADGEMLLREGADGIVFGCLHPDRTINALRVKTMVALANGKSVVFHKAIDQVPDMDEALKSLIACGVTRVLIGGGLGPIDQHLPTLTRLQATYGKAIELLPGGGLHGGNLHRFIDAGFTQLHMTGKRLGTDPLTQVTHVCVDEATLRSWLVPMGIR